ncbi:hypothetical protein MRX96_034502 [Rhipicephalus microplus]
MVMPSTVTSMITGGVTGSVDEGAESQRGLAQMLGGSVHKVPVAHRTSELARNGRHLCLPRTLMSLFEQDCRTAAYALTDSVRTRGVNPCFDFYQFCCGLWNVSQQGLEDGGNHSGTYQQWLEDRYVAHVNTRMLELLKSKNTDDDDDRNDPSPRRVARSYQSCIAFFANTTSKGQLSSMWHAAKLNTDAWMQVSTFSALFQLMICGILESHLPSALMIHSHKDGTVDVYPGSPIDVYG